MSDFISGDKPKAKKATPASQDAKELLQSVAKALDELIAAKNIGSTLGTWELRRSLAGYTDPAPITRVRKEIEAFLSGA